MAVSTFTFILIRFVCTALLYMLAIGQSGANDIYTQAKKKSWLKLIHYEADWTNAGKFRSVIHSPEFFLSPSGKTNPVEELRTSLEAMFEPVQTDPNQHAKCRFPARRIWLLQNFPEYSELLKAIDCPDFLAWSQLEKTDSVSLVFANGYLGNPASYYGHLFLKFNRASGSQSSYLIDQTLNFGAIGTTKDDPVSYIFKGIFGGYDGGFSPAEFYFHNASYTEKELRDLWEYQLSIGENDVRYIVSHAWEVTGKRYTYYFFRDNCAYRVAELIEIVDGIEIIPKNRLWTIPQAVLQNMNFARYQHKALIKNRIIHPSRQSRLYQKYRELDQKQRKIVASIVKQKERLDDSQIKNLPINEQQAILDTLLDYYKFTQDRKDAFTVSMSNEYVATLAARINLPPSNFISQKTNQEAPPDSGKAPSWVQLGFVHQQGSGSGNMLRIRPAYYDSLDVSLSQAKHGSLSMGDLMIQSLDDRLRVMHFDLIAIDSMSPAITGLPGDRSNGWRLRFGLEQERIGCRNCPVTRLQGDYGLGSTVSNYDILVALHAGGAMQANSQYDGSGFVRIGTSLVTRPTKRFGLKISHEWRHPLDDRRDDYRVTSAEARILIAESDTDLRFRWDLDFVGRLSIAIGHYW